MCLKPFGGKIAKVLEEIIRLVSNRPAKLAHSIEMTISALKDTVIVLNQIDQITPLYAVISNLMCFPKKGYVLVSAFSPMRLF